MSIFEQIFALLGCHADCAVWEAVGRAVPLRSTQAKCKGKPPETLLALAAAAKPDRAVYGHDCGMCHARPCIWGGVPQIRLGIRSSAFAPTGARICEPVEILKHLES